jgi:two-component system OmpR family response regulator
LRILIAEDDTETAEFVQRGLEQLGHNPAVAATGLDALHLLSTEQFDVAVIDRMLD